MDAESTQTPETPETAPEASPEATPEATPETAPEATPEAPEAEDAAGKGRAAREAARYRTKLRETEQALADTAAKLEALQLELARDIAQKAGLVDGRELDRPVSEFVNEDGLVDAEKVREAVRELLQAKPYLAARKPLPPTLPVPGHGGDPVDLSGGPTWAQLLGG